MFNRTAIALLLSVGNSASVSGFQEPISLIVEDAPRQLFSLGPIRRTQSVLGDATLNDVSRVGKLCWAVGDHGVVVRSEDSGQTWQTFCVPTECRLTSVCFLTNKVGWIAGVRFVRGVNEPVAVLFSTRDGGTTWTDLSTTPEIPLSTATSVALNKLPGIRRLHYFGLMEAVALTWPITTRNGATYVRSRDGGLSWEPVNNDQPGIIWEAAAFLSENEAILGGPQLTYGSVVGEQMVTVGVPTSTMRSVRAMSSDESGSSWIVGDGGLVLTSDNSGVSWSRSPALISSAVDRFLDFRAIAQQNELVLLGGTPGSVILRSPDNGRSWQRVSVPANGSLHKMLFIDETTLVAVGDLGVILHSSDSGQSWDVVRSGGFRPGVMSAVTEPVSQPWEVTAALAGEEGLRTVSVQLSSEYTAGDPASMARCGIQSEAGRQALSGLGGNVLASDWMFTRSRPELYRSQHQLLQEWNRQTDGQLRTMLPLRVAIWLRCFRPTVIVVEPKDDQDAVAKILTEVLPAAIELAAGTTGTSSPEGDHPVLASLLLKPWQVSRVIRRLPDGDTTALRFRSSDLLPHSGTTTGMMVAGAAEPLSWCQTAPLPALVDHCYTIVSLSGETNPPSVLAGVEAGLGSDARRKLDRRSGEEIRGLESTAQRAHIASAAAVGQLQRATTENSLIAELQSMGTDLPETFALQQIKGLGELTQKRGDVDGYFAVLQELIRRFPGTNESKLAAEELFILYSSAEVRRIRMDRMQSRHPMSGRLPGVSPIGQVQLAEQEGLIPSPNVEPATGVQFGGQSNDHSSSLLSRWDQQAQQAFAALGYTTAEQVTTRVALRKAANLRLAGAFGEHSTILAGLTQRDDEYQKFVRAEMQTVHSTAVSPVPVLNLQKAPGRPLLDAQLTDQCWEEAEEIFLRGATENSVGDPPAFVLATWDDEFLYLAGRFEHLPGGPVPESRAINRKHDADFGERDRLEFSLDIDRDYLTSLDFQIDQTGQTKDACGQIRNWDPQWFIASDTDTVSWRFEAAIPFRSLSLSPVRAGELWAVRFRRVVPAFTTQVLKVSGEETASGDGLGLIRFIRRQRK